MFCFRSKKALVFNMIGDRDAGTIIEKLIRCQFEYAFFCPNVIDPEKTPHLGTIPMLNLHSIRGYFTY